MASRRSGLWRFGFWAGLIVSWFVMVPLLWSAFASLPSEARLRTTRMARIPTLETFFMTLALSALELAVLLAVLWPWRARRYGLRVAVAAVGSAVWFLTTTPLSITRLQWVHRRWLFGVTLALIAAGVISGLVHAVRASRRSRSG